MPSFAQFLRRLAPAAIGLIGLITLWYGLIAIFGLAWYQMPAPHAVAQALVKQWGELGPALLQTAFHASLGFVVAIVLALLTSLVFAALGWVRQVLYPVLVLLQMVPVIASAAMIVILLDTGTLATISIAFLISYFPIMANTTRGLLEVPRDHADLFRLYRAQAWQVLFWLRLPQALPAFCTGLHIAATLVVIGTVTAELFATASDDHAGLGYFIFAYRSQVKTPELYAAALLCAALGFCYVGLASLVRHSLLSRWYALEVESGPRP